MGDIKASCTTMPDRFVQFGKEVAELARQHGMQNFQITLQPEWKADWPHQVTILWEQGRHGEDNRRFVLSSQVTVRCEPDKSP